jgi:beta-glucosidase
VWGVATAAHQIEGGNVNNDWWAWEHDPGSPCAEPSGDACDSFHRWPEDLDLVAGLGLGAYRFSLEWSRIEPADGEFSRAALEHYRRICAGCADRGIQAAVTFHHFTLPRWLARRGGFEATDFPERFARYVRRAADHLGDLIDLGCTLNEPNILGLLGYRLGLFPPGVSDRTDRADGVGRSLVRAHRLAVEELRAGRAAFPVGVTVAMAEMVALPGGEEVAAAARNDLEDRFLAATAGDDFVGVQAYTRMRFGPDGLAPPEPGVAVTQMGYEFWPNAAAHAVRRAAEATGLPVVVTENGIATDDDARRIDYLHQALSGVARCLADGVDVRGYVAWSLLDNFEWTYGFGPTFGLFSVDRRTFERRAKPSAAWYGAVARANRLPGPSAAPGGDGQSS